MKPIVRRTLHVRKEHELLQKLETAGLTDELAQRVIESKGNALAAKIVKLVADERPEQKPETPRKFTEADLPALLNGDVKLSFSEIGTNADFWKSTAEKKAGGLISRTVIYWLSKDMDAVKAQNAGVVVRTIMNYMPDFKVGLFVERVMQNHPNANSKSANTFAVSLLVTVKICDYQKTQPEFFLRVRNYMQDILRSGNYYGYKTLKDFFIMAAAVDGARSIDMSKSYHVNCTDCGPNCDCKG
ncbi:MAG: hypothetical protein HY226_06300 [Candidatus Vogelbacteria bacterium]|nr:hypothetical protein [Candidatus Vogelbacteria bacterium]